MCIYYTRIRSFRLLQMYVNKGVKPENPGLFMRPEVCPGCPFDKETFEHI
jgi:hypothetical protein